MQYGDRNDVKRAVAISVPGALPCLGVSEASLKPLFPDLPQVVLFEVDPLAEEAPFGFPGFAGLVSDRRQLDSAYVIGNLEKEIRCGGSISVHNGFFRNGFLDYGVYRPFNDALPVVVIDLHCIEGLKELEVVLDHIRDVFSHLLFQGGLICVFALQVGKGYVIEFNLLGKDSKSRKELLPCLKVHQRIVVVASCYGREVECLHGKPCVAERLCVAFDIGAYIYCLVMKNQSYQISLGARTGIARFVDEDGEFIHYGPFCRNKNAGGQPPATSTALLAERYLFYITTKGVLSRYDYTRTHVLSVLVVGAILRTVQPSSAGRCSLGFDQIWKAVLLCVREIGFEEPAHHANAKRPAGSKRPASMKKSASQKKPANSKRPSSPKKPVKQ